MLAELILNSIFDAEAVVINMELSVLAIEPCIHDCKLLKTHVGDVVIYRVKRHLNTVAHNLAGLS